MGSRRTPKHSRPVGRPLKILDENVQKILIDALKLGATVTLACEAAGIATSTFHGWMQRGYAEHVERSLEEGEPDDGESPYLELFEATQQARASAALRNVDVIRRVANGGTVLERTTETDPNGTERVIEKRQAPDWRAAAWFLQHSYGGDYRKEATQVEISGPGGGPVQIAADVEDLAKRLTEHLEVGAATTPRAIESVQVPHDTASEDPDESD